MKNQKIISFLLVCASLNLTAKESVQVAIPHKIQKRFHVLKEKCPVAQLKKMPYFAQLSSLLGQGNESVDPVLVAASLQELEQTVNQISDDTQKASIQLYLDKIKKDLEQVGLREHTMRSCMCNPCITPESSCTPGCPTAQVCIGNAKLSAPITIPSSASVSTAVTSTSESSTFSNQVLITNTTESADQFTGALVVNGGVGIGGDVNIGGSVTILDVTESTDCTTGAIVVSGGAGIGQNLNVCGDTTISGTTTITNSTQSTSCTSGAVVIGGGIGIGGNANVCGQVNISNTTQSSDCTSGSLVTGGGLGVAGNLNVCGQSHVINDTQSLGCDDGALVVDGGVGIGENLYVCGDTNLAGTLYVDQGATINEYLDVYGPVKCVWPHKYQLLYYY